MMKLSPRLGKFTPWSSLSSLQPPIFKQYSTPQKLFYPCIYNCSYNKFSSESKSEIPHMFNEANISDEMLDQLQYFHSLAMSDERWKVKDSELQNCLKKPPIARNDTGFLNGKLIPLLEMLRIVSPYQDPLSLMRTTYEQSSKRQILEAFKITSDDTDGNMFLFLIHAWLIHRKLVDLKLEELNTLYWEKVWDTYRSFLLAHQIRDTMFSKYLQEMQQVAIDFCIKLDHAFDSDSDYWSGLLRHTLWKNIYEQKGVSIADETLGELLVYILKMFQFLRLLPQETFSTGNFRWPDWQTIYQ